MSKWIVVTGSQHWGPFESAGAAGEFLLLASSSLSSPQSIVQLKDATNFQKQLAHAKNVYESRADIRDSKE